MSLRRRIDRIADEQGLDPDDIATELARAIGDAARRAWGERDLEVAYDEQTDAVVMYQVVRVVEAVHPERVTKEILAEDAAALEGQIGDELMLQVFYRDEDGPMAAAHSSVPAGLLPPSESLADGLPFPADAPAWMHDLWPARRMPWRFGRPVVLPELIDAIDGLRRWLEEVGADVDVRGSSPSEVAKVRQLGTTAQDLAILYERLGPSGEDESSLTVFGCPLLPIGTALEVRGEMTALVADGHVPASFWKPSWLPVFGGYDSGTRICLDLGTGAVVLWAEDEPAQPEGPSLAAWLGIIAVAAQAGLMRWADGMGMHCPGIAWEVFVELKARAFPA